MKQSSDPAPKREQDMQGIKECPLCTATYGVEDVRVVREEDATQLVHVTCEKCHQALLAYIVESRAGMSSIGMLTDLTLLDVLRMREKEPISEDDLLGFHETLAQHQTHFLNYLKKHTV